MIEQFYWFQAGYCTAIEKFCRKGGGWNKVKFPAAVGLWKHRTHGYILFDTGYAPRFYEATRRLPAKLMRWLLPTYVNESDAAVAQMHQAGISVVQISHILISHMHVDHVGGLADFPQAQIHLHQAATFFLDLPKKNKPVQGVLPTLLPEALRHQSSILYEANAQPDPIFGHGWDMFGDGSIKIVPLPGHAQGQIGAIFHYGQHEWLLAADAAWFMQEIEEQHLPPFPGNKVIYDKDAYRKTLQRLKCWQEAQPNRIILPTHCPVSFNQYQRPLHEA